MIFMPILFRSVDFHILKKKKKGRRKKKNKNETKVGGGGGGGGEWIILCIMHMKCNQKINPLKRRRKEQGHTLNLNCTRMIFSRLCIDIICYWLHAHTLEQSVSVVTKATQKWLLINQSSCQCCSMNQSMKMVFVWRKSIYVLSTSHNAIL